MYARLLIDAENTKLVVLSEGRPMYDSLSQYKYAQHGLGCFRVAPVTFHTQTGSSLSSVLEALHLSVSGLAASSPYTVLCLIACFLQAMLLYLEVMIDRKINTLYYLGFTFNHGVLLLTLGTNALSILQIEANEIGIQ